MVRWVLVCGDAAQCDGWMTPEKLAAVRGRSQQLTQRINHPEDRIGTAVGESPVTEPVQPLGGEAGQPTGHRLLTAPQRRGDGGTRSPSQDNTMICARRIQSAGACRTPASLRILRSSTVSTGGRANSSFVMVDHHHGVNPGILNLYPH